MTIRVTGTPRCEVCKRKATAKVFTKRGRLRYLCDRHDPNYVPDDDRLTPGGSPIFY